MNPERNNTLHEVHKHMHHTYERRIAFLGTPGIGLCSRGLCVHLAPATDALSPGRVARRQRTRLATALLARVAPSEASRLEGSPWSALVAPRHGRRFLYLGTTNSASVGLGKGPSTIPRGRVRLGVLFRPGVRGALLTPEHRLDKPTLTRTKPLRCRPFVMTAPSIGHHAIGTELTRVVIPYWKCLKSRQSARHSPSCSAKATPLPQREKGSS